MASLDKRGKNSYRLRWIENGERKFETFNADSFYDAQIKKRQKEEELQRVKSSQLRLSDLWELYKRDRPRRGNKKHEEAYLDKALEFFGNCFLYEISASHLNDYKNWLLKQPNKNYKKKRVFLSSTYVLTCLKRFQTVWNYGKQENLIDIDIFKGFRFPQEAQREFVLSVREFNHLYEMTKKENLLYAEFLKLLIQTGWRRGELYNLKWADIGDVHITLRQTKSYGTDQKYPAFNFIKITLQEIYNLQKKHSEYVWADEKGNRLAKVTISRMVSRYMKKADFPEGVAHTLRHSFATNSQANGLSIYEANLLLRQSSIKMTERYSHLKPNQVDESKVDFLNPYNHTIFISGLKYRINPITNILEQIK